MHKQGASACRDDTELACLLADLCVAQILTGVRNVKQLHRMLEEAASASATPAPNSSSRTNSSSSNSTSSNTNSATNQMGGGGRDVERVSDLIVSRLDETAGRWPKGLARRAARLAVRCIEKKRALRPDLHNDIHPGLVAIAEEAAAEKQRRAKEMDNRFICPLSKVSTEPGSVTQFSTVLYSYQQSNLVEPVRCCCL